MQGYEPMMHESAGRELGLSSQMQMKMQTVSNHHYVQNKATNAINTLFIVDS